MAEKTTKHVEDNRWQAWVQLKLKPGTPKNFWEKWARDKRIKEGWTTTGDYDLSMMVDVGTPDELEDVVWKDIRNSKWVEKTETHWVKKWW